MATSKIHTDRRTGRRYVFRTVYDLAGPYMQAVTLRRYRVERQWIDLTNGDLVRNGSTGPTGVITDENYSSTQVEVAVEPYGDVPGHIAVWYVSRLTVV